MRYQGSKHFQGKEIVEYLKDKHGNFTLVEPFVGGCNLTKYYDGPRLAFDLNKSLILMWESLQFGWLPPETISRELYHLCRSEYQAGETSALIGYVGIVATFGNCFYQGGYATGGGRNHSKEAYHTLLKELPKLKTVVFKHSNYKNVTAEGLYYCDPPYKNTLGYNSGFDSDEFWEWAEKKKAYVSEVSAPNGWIPVLKFKKRGESLWLKQTPRL